MKEIDSSHLTAEKLVAAFETLCAASRRQAAPGLQVTAGLDHLEVTLRFESDPTAKTAGPVTGEKGFVTLDRAVLRQLAAMAAGCAA